MAKFVIFDFEVFKFDVLLGAYIVSEEGIELFQSWDTDCIKDIYKDNIKSIWIGHNNENYDNHILEAVIKDKNVKQVSDDIINERKRNYLNIPLYYYDLIKFHPASLKVMEAFMGKNISESKIDFNIEDLLVKYLLNKIYISK